MQLTPSVEWWRPDASPARAHPAAASLGVEDAGAAIGAPARGRVAFGALIAFTIILVASPQEYFPVLQPLRIALVAGLIALIACWAQRLQAGPEPGRISSRAVTLAVCLLAWSAITIPASVWRGGSLDLLLTLFLKSVIVFWLLGVVVNTHGRLLTMVWTLSLLILPLAVTALRQYAAGEFVRAGRIDGYADGIAGNPNDLALLVVIILPLTLALALASRRWLPRLVAAGLVVIGAAAVVATFSRSGFLVLATVALLYVISLVRRGAVVIGVAVLLLALAAVPLLPQGLGTRLATITDIESDATGSAQQRWRDMQIAADYVLHLPLVGAGLGMNVLVLNELRGPEWTQVHNAYLEYGMDLGVTGLLLFLALFYSVTAGAGRAARTLSRQPAPAVSAEIARAVQIGLLAFAVAALFYPVGYHFYFYYLAGLSVAVQRLSARLA
jgi:O-antigen ligase